jgi:uridine phosphorylase
MQPHLKVEALPQIILCPGDPARAAYIATFLDNAKQIAANREYHTFVGSFDGISVGVVSTGVGAAGAAIAYHEAINAGARCLIRIGTAGKLQPIVKSGDIVIALAAIREDGVSQQLVPLEFPALADFEVVLALMESAKKLSIQFHVGLVHTTGLFYPLTDRSLPRSASAGYGALCVEMECSILFVLGSIHKVRTAAILAINGDASKDPGPVKKAVDNAINIVLHSLKTITLLLAK